MKQITARVPDTLHEEIERESEELGVPKSEIIRERLQHADDVEQLEKRVEELKTERDRLQRALEAANKRVDEHQELAEYVSEEKSLREREHQRRREREQAGLLTRARWWAFGRDFEQDDQGSE